MKLTGFAGALIAYGVLTAAIAPAGAVELDQRHAVLAPPVNAAPVWYVTTDQAGTQQPIEVRSLTTGRPLGLLPTGYRFLAFGASPGVITLGLGGQVGYIPAGSASEMFPLVARPMEWKAAGPTLEEQAEIARQEAREAQAQGLEPLSLKRRTEEAKQAELLQQSGQIQGQPGVPLIGADGGRDGAI